MKKYIMVRFYTDSGIYKGCRKPCWPVYNEISSWLRSGNICKLGKGTYTKATTVEALNYTMRNAIAYNRQVNHR